jgi:hypothetical protein
MNRYFNSSRFIKLLKYDMALHKKKYVLFALVMFAVLFFASYYLLDNSYKIRAKIITELNFNRKLNEYQVFCVFCYLCLSILVVSTSFSFFRSKEEASNYLRLPASIFEKFLHEFLIRIVLFNIVFLILFWLSFKLATYAFMAYYSYNPVDVNIYRLIDIPNFGILEQFTFYKTVLDRNVVVFSLFSFTTFMLAGASYFKKYALFKTVLAFGGLLVFAYLITLFSYHLFLPNKVNLFKLQVIDRNLSNGYDTALIALSVIGAFSSLFLLPFTYFKLKEKEA